MKNGFKKAVCIITAITTLTAMSCKGAPDDDTQNPGGNTPVGKEFDGDVKIPTINPNATQAEIDAQVKNVLGQLMQQSKDIQKKYEDRDRYRMAGYQEDIQADYDNVGIHAVESYVDGPPSSAISIMDNKIAPAIYPSYQHQQQLKAYRNLHAIKQRKHWGVDQLGYNKDQQIEAAIKKAHAYIGLVNGEDPSKNLDKLIEQLKASLEKELKTPVESDPFGDIEKNRTYAMDIIQQNEDMGQAHGFKEDLAELNFSYTWVRLDNVQNVSMTAPTKTRGQIQTENGLVK